MNQKEVRQFWKRRLLRLYSDITRASREIMNYGSKSTNLLEIWSFIDLSPKICLYRKEYDFDCGVQALRSALSFFRSPPSTKELMRELEFCWALSPTHGLLHNNIEKAPSFMDFDIQYFPYLWESEISKVLLLQKIPIIVSIHKNGGNHLVLVSWGECNKSRIVSVICWDSSTGEYTIYSWSEFIRIYNFRGIILTPKQAKLSF